MQDDNTETRPLLVLDLDETLVHATVRPLNRPPDDRVSTYHVYRRPHLHGFLATCSRTFRVAVWSSGGSAYVNAVVATAFPPGLPLEFVWTRERCVRRFDEETRGYYDVKDLKKVKRRGYDLDRTLIVDDTPRKLERNYGNAVYVPPFVGDPDDDVLPALAEYLVDVGTERNFRDLEKRGWYARRRDEERWAPATASS